MRKSLKNDDGSFRFIKTMKAHEAIKATRDYLVYVDTHISNVRRAFIEITDACEGMAWVGDDKTWHALRHEVENHDVSKLSARELCQYRDEFYPCPANDVHSESFVEAWDHHKEHNSHHHEVVRNEIDVIHMVIDWTAMSYVFGDTAESYYENNADSITLSKDHKALMLEIFERIRKAALLEGEA